MTAYARLKGELGERCQLYIERECLLSDRLRVVGARRYGALSPLRYPGGKAALAGFFEDLIGRLDIVNPHYIEPYAGGAGAGIALLAEEVVERITINDIDPAVHAFWTAATKHTDEMMRLVHDVPLSVDEWKRQRDIYKNSDSSDILALGFSFFYLNRTNRSGILNGGVIGGLAQRGKYKIDARFNRKTLIDRLERIGNLSDRITVLALDGRTVVSQYATCPNVFMYIDPPYVDAGSKLYLNSFEVRDHEKLAETVDQVESANWIVTYDQSELISELYKKHFQCELELTYSAQKPGKAVELLIASAAVRVALSS
ncbi:DNA adenine methylase [Schaalia dentiphila]|uniref:DNA adenine methylase n=1 Tax=Schaalia dentiphila TaxID=3050224 RepID=UPI002852C11C|nr:DNA adenine methylase [Schaalia sp. C24]